MFLLERVRALPLTTSVCVTAAVVLSLYFQGSQVEVFSAALSLLVVCLLLALWRLNKRSITVPVNAMALCLTLFWAWLAIGLVWSPVWYTSVFEFWWMGAMPIMFWSYVLEPNRAKLWSALAPAMILVVVTSALFSIWQFFHLNQQPVSTFLNANSHAALLMLVAVPLASIFLLVSRGETHNGRKAMLAGLYFVLVFAIALTKGRAVSASLLGALVLIVVAGHRYVTRRGVLTLGALTVGAYLLAAIGLQGALTERFSELHAPLQVESMQTRVQIWEATWRMIQDSPWWGVGPGLFSQLYPAYRHPMESSSGFFAHNDYLQLWLEAGIPGMALLLAAMLAATLMFVRAMKSRRLVAEIRLEMIGLYAGVAAVAAHSFVDMNFHVLTILIVTGAALARFQELAGYAIKPRPIKFRRPAFLSVPAYRLVLVLLAGFPIFYFATIAFAVHEEGRAQRFANDGDLSAADVSFHRAFRLYPYVDNVLVNHADLYRYVLSLTPKTKIDERRELFDRAMEFLDRAEHLDPLRALNPVVRASLYEQNPDLADADVSAAIERAYQRALALNPRFYAARLAYAKYLVRTDRADQAREIAEAGLREFYFDHAGIVPYFLFCARLRMGAGDAEGAATLRQRAERSLANSGGVRLRRPEDVRPIGVL